MQLLTLPKLAAQSGWPESRIRRMVARHQLAHIRVNGRLLLPQTAIEDYVAQNFVDPNARIAPKRTEISSFRTGDQALRSDL